MSRHPQASAQCARFIRDELPQAEVRAAPSTADAVREVAAARRAVGGARRRPRRRRSTAASCCARESRTTPATSPASSGSRPAGTEPPAATGPWKTTLSFSELGADHPGALVEALTEFSSRDVNLTRIESRPLRQGLGRYMFFVDLEGADGEAPVAEAIAALRTKAENVRVLGSYPLDERRIPGA